MKNSYEVRGNVTAIFVKGKGITYECLIDTSDLEKTKQFPFTWFVNPKGYVWGHTSRKTGKRSAIYIHRYLMDINDRSKDVDHLNHNTLDNRRSMNLRIATKSENGLNRLGPNPLSKSGYRGVSWESRRNKWQAHIKLNYKRIYLGLYDTPEEAYKAFENKLREVSNGNG
jgi:hypothetical protein